MTTERTAAPLLGGVALLERAIGYTLGSLVLVTPDDLHRSTPCRAWDLAALLDHMNDSLLTLGEAAIGRIDLEPEARGDGDAVEAVATLRSRACRLLGDWSAPERGPVTVGGRRLTSSLVAVIGAVEIAVHGWDVAQACRRPRAIPSGLGEELLELAPLFVAGAGGEQFARPIEVPPSAPAGDKLVAFLGRVPG